MDSANFGKKISSEAARDMVKVLILVEGQTEELAVVFLEPAERGADLHAPLDPHQRVERRVLLCPGRKRIVCR